MSTNPPLRVAILVNSPRVFEWQFQLLKKIQHQGNGTIVLAITRGEPEGQKADDEKQSLALSLFYRHTYWDRDKFKQKPDAFAKRDLAELKDSVPTISMTPQVTRWSDRLSQRDIATLREHDIDVIVRLGWRIIKGDMLTVPRHGVWSFHHGDNQINRGGPPAVWEHYYGQCCTGVTLQVLSEKLDDGLILDRSYTATDKTSVSKTRSKLYWRSVDMLPRKLAELRQLGGDILSAHSDNRTISFYSQPLLTEKKMSLKEVLLYIGRSLYAYAKQAVFERLYIEKWVLYFRIADEMSTSLWQFTKIESPNDRYWADPHIIKRDGTYYVFVEEYMFDTKRGRIAVIPVEADGTVGEAQTVLDPDYHLSYPFVFERDGETYMIPESGENRSVDLYKCVSFPDKWELEKTLIKDAHAVDTTLYEHNGRWWMFTNRRDTAGGTTHDELHVYSATHFVTDNWTPHPQGVVVSDVRCARPAGALFKNNGKLYRPGQDCSVDYGYAMQIMEVTELSEERYSEIPATRITPDWNDCVVGVHTFNHVDGMSIVDAKTFIKKKQVI